MAVRVNTKFVLILSVVLALIAGAVITLYLVTRDDPAKFLAASLEHEQKARQIEQQIEQELQNIAAEPETGATALNEDGEPQDDSDAQDSDLSRVENLEKQMIKHYQHALQNLSRVMAMQGEDLDDATRIEYLMRRARLMQKIPSTRTQEASERMDQVVAHWQRVTDIQPDHLEANVNLMEYFHELANRQPVIAVWNMLYNTSSDLILVLPETEDNLELRARTRKYRGLAGVVRIERLGEIPQLDRQQALEDLQFADEHLENDIQIPFNLARWYLLEAQEAERNADTAAAEQLQQQALQIIGEYYQQNRDNLEATINYFRVIASLDEYRDQAMELLPTMEQMASQSDDPQLIQQVANLLWQLDRENVELANGETVRRGVIRAEKLVRDILQQDPDNLQAMVELGLILKNQQRLEEAVQWFEHATEDRKYAVVPGVRAALSQQWSAMKELADIAIVSIERTEDPEQQQALQEQAQSYVDELEAAGAPLPLQAWMQGKLHLADGKFDQAAMQLETAHAGYNKSNYEVAMLTARALWHLGQTGQAAKRLEDVLNTQRGRQLIAPYLEMARIRAGHGEHEQALGYLDVILDVVEDHPQALMLKAKILADHAASVRNQRGDNAQSRQNLTQAMEIINQLSDQPETHAAAEQLRVQLLLANNQLDQAHDVLLAAHEANPQDVATLVSLVRVEHRMGHSESALQRLNQAIEARPDAAAILEVYRKQLAGDDDEAIADDVWRLIEGQEEGLDRYLAEYRFLKKRGDDQAAGEALKRAMQVDATDTRVMEARFNEAIQAEDWDRALEVVADARRTNIDQAEGAFWRGRYELARGEHRNAVITLSQAVKKYPLNANGYILLGDAQRFTDDYASAERSYREALNLQPDNTLALRRLAMVFDHIEQHASALEHMRKAIIHDPTDMELRNSYWYYETRHGDPSIVIRQRQQLAESNPENHANRRALAQLLLQQNQTRNARTILEQLMREAPQDRANVLALSLFELEVGDFQAAADRMKRYVHNLEQPTMEDWLAYARFLRRSGQSDQAMAAYRLAIENQPSDSIKASSELADWHYQLGNYAKATDLFQAIYEQSEDVNIWHRVIETQIRTGQFDQAEENLRQLVSEHEPSAQSALLEGMLAMARGNNDQALSALNQAVQLAPNNPQVYFYRARFRMDSASSVVQQLVREDLEQAIELGPNMILPRMMLAQWYANRQEITSAAAVLNKLMQAHPTYIPARQQLAEFYLMQNRLSDFDRLMTESRQAIPGTPLWHQLQARRWAMEGRNSRVIDELTQAYDLDSSLSTLWPLSNALLEADQPERVLSLLRQWGPQMQRFPQLKALQARAMAAADQTEQAQQLFIEAFDLAQNNPAAIDSVLRQLRLALPLNQVIAMVAPRVNQDASGFYGLIHARLLALNPQRTDEAIQQLEQLKQKLAKDAPVYREALSVAANLYHRVDLKQKAEQAYRELLETTPEDWTALNNLAFLLAEDLNRPEEALELARKAVQFAPDRSMIQANILDSLGYIQYLNGQYEQANETLRRSIAMNDSLPASRLHLARVLIKLGNHQEALEHLNTGRRLAEKDDNAAEWLDKINQELSKLQASESDEDPLEVSAGQEVTQ